MEVTTVEKKYELMQQRVFAASPQRSNYVVAKSEDDDGIPGNLANTQLPLMRADWILKHLGVC